MPEPATPLPSFDEPISRVLVVVAHPDDAEYGTSAAVATWTTSGVEVSYLLLTAGEAGMQRPPEEAGPLRANEQRAACDAVGVGGLTILDFPDGALEYSLDLRRAIAREIRRVRPDVVIGGSGELLTRWGFDHADHRAAGLATIDAVRDADNRWCFRDLLDEGLEPWGATWLFVVGAMSPTHHVAVSEEGRDRAVRSLAAHAAYLADLPWHPKPEDVVDGVLSGGGKESGVARAVTFGVHRLRG
ncbi:MAG TPA: PIG-L deacetylase family protein [Propionibacteriaceae bacterium]|nr:PIG-L deacetylase family protein [Propionibacteriaceae bacterium]